MYPKKGVIAPGSDADIVVWDPNAKTTIGINDKHHMNMDHSAWEGWVIDGKVDTVLSPRHGRHRERRSTSAPRATASIVKPRPRPTYLHLSLSSIDGAHRPCVSTQSMESS